MRKVAGWVFRMRFVIRCQLPKRKGRQKVDTRLGGLAHVDGGVFIEEEKKKLNFEHPELEGPLVKPEEKSNHF